MLKPAEHYSINEKLTPRNQSIDKLFRIIEVMIQNPGSMRLQDIAIQSGIPASTVLRMLQSIVAIGYAHQDPITNRYSLSLKFCQIGEAVRSQFSLTDIIRPKLIELSSICHESACLAIEQDMTVVYIDVVDGQDNILRTLQRIGKQAPMHCTGVGKVLLTNYSAEELNTYFYSNKLIELTPNTITDINSLIQELSKIKKQGYALDDEECELGAKCIAAPIYDYSGQVIAGISISGPTSRMTPDRLSHCISYVTTTASDISSHLGYTKA